MSDLIDAKGEFFTKSAAASEFFQIDWAAELGPDTITTATWVVPSGITSANQTFTPTTTRIKLSGGTAGVEYAVSCTVATLGAQVLGPRTLWVRIVPFPTLAENALIDLDYLKTAMRLYEANPESSIDNRLLAQKINEASDLIETYCGRSFHTADYVERIDWAPRVNLKQYPLHYVRTIHRSTRSGLLLTNNATGKDYATAWVSGNRKLYLSIQGGASHGLQTIDLTLPANDTLGELLTVISGLSGNWIATLSTGRTGNERSDDLVEQSPCLVESTGLTMELLALPDLCAYRIHESAGIISDLSNPYRGSDYRYANGQAWVKYRAGYDEIPDDLKGITAQICKHLYYESTRDSGLRSETIGDYSYTRESGQDVEGTRASVPGHMLMALSAYENPVIA